MQRFETSEREPFYGHYIPIAGWLLDVISGSKQAGLVPPQSVLLEIQNNSNKTNSATTICTFGDPKQFQ